MTSEDSRRQQPLHLPEHIDAINVGLPLFADALDSQGVPVTSVDWRIPGGGEPGVVAALRRLYGPHAARVDAANAEVFRRLDEGVPTLVDVVRADEAVPALTSRTLLHCGPAISFEQVCDPLRRSMRAAVVAEGWASTPEQAQAMLARGEVALAPANEHDTVLPMATALGPTQPLWKVRNDPGGTVGYAPFNQGPGEVAWFGMDSPAAIARLEFLRDTVAPVLTEVLRQSGPVRILDMAAEAVAMGDDVHVRVQAATNLLIRHWLPQLVAVETAERVRVAHFLSRNHLFFLTLAMAAARALTAWAGQVEDSSIVTTMARNGTTFGIRLAGSDDWHLDEAPEVGHAIYYPGQGPENSARDIGDSAVLELIGLGASAAGGSPSVAQLVGGTMADARALTERMDAGCLGRSGRFKLATLNMRGTPLGLDVRRVVERGLTPGVSTGILHASDGTGQVGAGVAEAPLACFTAAAHDLDVRLSALTPQPAARW